MSARVPPPALRAPPQRKPTPEAKLTALLVKKNLKPADIITQWDSDHGGSIDANEFVKNVLKMGLDVTREELLIIFKRFDTSGDGEVRRSIGRANPTGRAAHGEAKGE